jgi:D-alanyl-D-alanine carboxypeptidase/D-alanyl-D-alanine-endopeptidase (penicillin-binding protein 4)
VPAEALSVVVQEVGSAPALEPGADIPRNPASVFKLLTTYAALDQLGPAWTWQTPVYLTGPVRDGVLDGSVLLRGSGDPSLVLERVWLLLRHLQQRACTASAATSCWTAAPGSCRPARRPTSTASPASPTTCSRMCCC